MTESWTLVKPPPSECVFPQIWSLIHWNKPFKGNKSIKTAVSSHFGMAQNLHMWTGSCASWQFHSTLHQPLLAMDSGST